MPNKLDSKSVLKKATRPAPTAPKQRLGARADTANNDSPTSASVPGFEVGATIRKRRRDMGLTLAQVGERSGFTTGYLSQLERNLATPSLVALVGISRALGVELDYFLGTPNGRGHHFPVSRRDFFCIGRQGMQYARVSGEFPSHGLNALVVRVPPHYSSPEPMTLQGEELVYVIEGQLRYTMGDRQFELTPGDVVHLPSNIPHRWENPSNDEGAVLWIGTDQIFNLGPSAVTASPAEAAAASNKPVTRKPAGKPLALKRKTQR